MTPAEHSFDASALAGGAAPALPATRRRTNRMRLRGRECRLCGTLVLDGRRVPLGPCWVQQRRREATLSWTAPDGARQQRDISMTQLRQLLDEGLLQQGSGDA